MKSTDILSLLMSITVSVFLSTVFLYIVSVFGLKFNGQNRIIKLVILSIYWGVTAICVKTIGVIFFKVNDINGDLLTVSCLICIMFLLSEKDRFNKDERTRAQYEQLLEANRRIALQEERYQSIFDAGYEGLWEFNLLTDTLYCSTALEKILGYDYRDFISDEKYSYIHPEDLNMVRSADQKILDGLMQYYELEYRIRNSGEDYSWIKSKLKSICDEHHKIIRIVGSISNINDRKLNEERIMKMAYSDKLTGLHNRRAFYEKLNDILTNTKKSGAIIYIDTDNFKNINDTLGHGAGDKILEEIGSKLSVIHNSSTFVARLGGDEFVVIKENYTAREPLNYFIINLLEIFRSKLDSKYYNLNITASAGISIFPNDGTDVDSLLQYADIALYRAKEMGKNRFCYFSNDIQKEFHSKIVMENLLRSALENDEYYLNYQPQIDLEKGLCGFEALIRWNNPILGLVSPAAFIPIAEDIGIINEIGTWVIKNACSFFKQLHTKYPDVKLSVNIAPKQLEHKNFVDTILKLINESGIDNRLFCIELTESSFLQSFSDNTNKLLELKKSGIRISLDDFGTGYSSLNHLIKLPIDTIKIDKSFVDDIQSNSLSRDMIHSIINLSHKIGLEVIAEGVELKEQYHILNDFGCDIIQGYYFSKPLTEIQVLDYLDKQLELCI